MTNKLHHVYIDNETFKKAVELKYALGLKTIGEAFKIMADYYVEDNI